MTKPKVPRTKDQEIEALKASVKRFKAAKEAVEISLDRVSGQFRREYDLNHKHTCEIQRLNTELRRLALCIKNSQERESFLDVKVISLEEELISEIDANVTKVLSAGSKGFTVGRQSMLRKCLSQLAELVCED